MKKLWQDILIAAVCGAALGLGFVSPYLWWSTGVGLIGLLIYTKKMRETKQAWWCGWVIGSVKMLLVLSWFWYVYPLERFGFEPSTLQLFTIGVLWIAAAAVMGAGTGLLVVSLHVVMKHIKRKWYLLGIFPILLLVSEIVGAILFSLATKGSESVVGGQFSFGFSGYTLASHGLLGYFLQWYGVYALTMVIGFLAALVFVGRVYRPQYQTLIFVGSLLLFTGSSFISVHANQLSPTTTVISVHIDEDEKQEALTQLLNPEKQKFIPVFEHALQAGADYIVFPETVAALGAFESDEAVFARIESLSPKPVVVIDSVISAENYIQTKIYDSKSGTVQLVNKSYLVPMGEYIPYFLKRPLQQIGIVEEASVFENQTSFISGENMQATLDSHVPGILFCFDVINPIQAKQLIEERELPFIAHQVSHAWFNEPMIFWYQLDQMLRAQAGYAQTPIIQATNSGLPFSYGSNGKYIPSIPIFSQAGITAYIHSI